MPSILLSLLIPSAAIAAACIAAIVSFLALLLAKEQKTSEFRQTWIDGLRSEISEFAGHARRISLSREPISQKMFTNTIQQLIDVEKEEFLRPDKFHENRQRMAQTYYSLRLRLNPSETDHQALLSHLDNIYSILNSFTEPYTETIIELEAVSAVSRTILKREWNRVKEGEKAFRIAKATAKWGFIFFITTFTFSILFMLTIYVSRV